MLFRVIICCQYMFDLTNICLHTYVEELRRMCHNAGIYAPESHIYVHIDYIYDNSYSIYVGCTSQYMLFPVNICCTTYALITC